MTMRVAFLGLGRMGSAMAMHVVQAGHELTVWNRTPGKAGELVSSGAREAESVADAVRDAEAVVLMLFGPDSDREVLAEVCENTPQGCLVIDSTTIGPADARTFGDQVVKAGLRYVDAPVAGTVGPAKQGTLGVFVGGSDEDFDAARPLLELWGDPDKVRHVGGVGSAAALKIVVNLALGVTIEGLGEALRLADRLDVDEQVAMDALSAGPFGWALAQKRAMVESGDYTPAAFSLELLAKDLGLCVGAAGGGLPAVAAALDSARAGVEAGHGGDDYARVAEVARRR